MTEQQKLLLAVGNLQSYFMKVNSRFLGADLQCIKIFLEIGALI